MLLFFAVDSTCSLGAVSMRGGMLPGSRLGGGSCTGTNYGTPPGLMFRFFAFGSGIHGPQQALRILLFR